MLECDAERVSVCAGPDPELVLVLGRLLWRSSIFISISVSVSVCVCLSVFLSVDGLCWARSMVALHCDGPSIDTTPPNGGEGTAPPSAFGIRHITGADPSSRNGKSENYGRCRIEKDKRRIKETRPVRERAKRVHGRHALTHTKPGKVLPLYIYYGDKRRQSNRPDGQMRQLADLFALFSAKQAA